MRLRFSGPEEHGDDPLGGIHDIQSEGLNPLRGLSPHDNEILDMSTAGACIRTSTLHKPGKRLMFEINLSDAEAKIIRLAEVQWIRPDDKKFRVGIKFIRPSAGELSHVPSSYLYLPRTAYKC